MSMLATRLTGDGNLYTTGEFFESVNSLAVDGLQMYLDAGDPASYPGSGTAWLDLSGTGANVAMVNSDSITWNSGGWFSTGSSGYFSGAGTGTTPTGNSNYTLQAMIRLPSTGGGNGILSIGGFGVANLSNALRMANPDNLLNYWWGNDLDLPCGAVANEWFVATATYDGTNRTLYLNGTALGSDVPGNSHAVPTSTTRVAATWVENGELLVGDIAAALIYDTALSADQIAANALVLLGRFSQPQFGTSNAGVYATTLDEVTLSDPVIPQDGLVLWLDAANPASYPGTVIDTFTAVTTNATFVDGVATCTATPGDYSSQVYSTEGYSSNVTLTVTLPMDMSNEVIFFGLSSDPSSSTNFAVINYGIYIFETNDAEIFQLGSGTGTFTVAGGDTLSMTFTGNAVLIDRNGSNLATFAGTGALTLYADILFNSVGSTALDVSWVHQNYSPVWYDLSPSAAHCNLMGNPSFSNSNGGYLTFLPSNTQYGQSQNQVFGTLTHWTINSWVYMLGTAINEFPAILTQYWPNYGPIQYCLSIAIDSYPNCNRIAAQYFDGAAWHYAPSSPVEVGQWVMYTGSWDGTHICLYVNGQLYSKVLSTTTVSPTSEYYFVARRWDAPNYLHANIATIQMWDHALSAGEIGTLFGSNYRGFVTGGVVQRQLSSNILQVYNELDEVTYGRQILQADLWAWFDAGNSSSYPGSGTTWSDISGHGWSATLDNVEYEPAGGGSMLFFGSFFSSHAVTNIGDPGSMPISMSFWVYPQVSAPVAIYDSAPGQANVLRQYSASGPSSNVAEWWDADPYAQLDLGINAWQYVTINYWYDGTRHVDTYVNGVPVDSATGSNSSTYAWTTYTLGTYNNGGAYYQGYISQVQIYKRRLSAAEALYNYRVDALRYGLTP